MGKETVAEEDDGAKDREELPGGGDDGAGQGAELRHAHEDEKLGETKVSPSSDMIRPSLSPGPERWPQRSWPAATGQSDVSV